LSGKLEGHGISCGGDKNFLGNIHSFIKRSKDIEEVGVGGRKIYSLNTEFPQNPGKRVPSK
jgi:hypothetical protein